MTAVRLPLPIWWLSAVALAVGHAAATWGHITPFWGDYGKWLFEVQQVARGAVLYRDVYWPQLPLSAWAVGGWVAVMGEDLRSVWTFTAFLYAGIVATFLAVVREVVIPEWRLAVALAGVLLVAALSQVESTPLPLGMYTPAAPLGGMLLLSGVLLGVRQVAGKGSASMAFLLGAVIALSCWSKVDFGPPALVTLVWVAWSDPPRRLPLYLGFGLTGVLVAAAVVHVVPLQRWGEMILGFGQAAEFGSRSLPTLPGAIAELTMTALWMATIGALMWRVLPIAWIGSGAALAFVSALAAGFFALDYAEGGRAALVVLRQEALMRPIPVAAPLLALVVVWRWRGVPAAKDSRLRLLQLLAAVVVAARLRRLAHHADWHHVALELPLYGALLAEVMQRFHVAAASRARFGGALASSLLVVGVASHWALGRGPFTRRGSTVPVVTTRGTIHVSPDQARLYETLAQQLAAADPTGLRPLFAFSYSGGLNYFLGRPNPTSLTQGFRFVGTNTVDSAMARLRETHDSLFLVENPYMQAEELPVTVLDLIRGNTGHVANVYARVDRPIFDRLAVGCHPVTGADRRGIHLLDCRP